MPRVTRDTDARKFETEQPDDVVLPSTGGVAAARARAADELNTQEIEPVLGQGVSDVEQKAQMLAFFEEKIEIHIHDSTDINPEPHIFLSVNGRGAMPDGSPWVPRAQNVTIARKYVEQLARAKPVNLRTVPALDGDGFKTTALKRTSSLRYPFSVIRDPNPKGAAWLRDLMRQR